MSTPPTGPRPRDSTSLLARLTTLSHELAGAYRPTTAVELAARALVEILAPSRISIVLLNTESNCLALAYDSAPEPARIDDPLLQLALRRGPLLLARDRPEGLRYSGAEISSPEPALWG